MSAVGCENRSISPSSNPRSNQSLGRQESVTRYNPASAYIAPFIPTPHLQKAGIFTDNLPANLPQNRKDTKATSQTKCNVIPGHG